MKKIIGFDMDGVIIDHSEIRVKLAKKLGFDLSLNQTSSDVLRTIIPEKERRMIQNDIYNNPEIALRAPLMPGVADGLGVIKKSGVPYYLISRRKDPELAIRLLSERGLWPFYFNSENTYFVPTAEGKSDKAKELSITHYVDDEVWLLRILLSVKYKILFDPYKVHGNGEYIDVANWQDLTRYLLE